MLILGIETSCDETAAAVVENGRRVLSNIIFSQIPIHEKTGGVVPEVAAREHSSAIIPVIERALKEAGVTPDDLSAVSATQGPGLIGCLLTGLTTAKTLALVWRKPFIAVDHIQGHLMSPWLYVDAPLSQGTPAKLHFYCDLKFLATNASGLLTVSLSDTASSAVQRFRSKISNLVTKASFAGVPQARRRENGAVNVQRRTFSFPIVSLTASGGHNELVLLRAPRKHCGMPHCTILGQTLDDAAGEAYDKAARIMGLGYPGGPAISKAAVGGNPHRYPLPRAWLEKGKNSRKWHNFSFSFSGLKSALLRLVEQSQEPFNIADLAASFQEAVNDVLATKLLLAAERYRAREIHIAGGVSANTDLREKIRAAVETKYHPLLGGLTFSKNLTFRTPQTLSFCTDNAAMIAGAGYFYYKKNPRLYRKWRNVEPYSDR